MTTMLLYPSMTVTTAKFSGTFVYYVGALLQYQYMYGPVLSKTAAYVMKMTTV